MDTGRFHMDADRVLVHIDTSQSRKRLCVAAEASVECRPGLHRASHVSNHVAFYSLESDR